MCIRDRTEETEDNRSILWVDGCDTRILIRLRAGTSMVIFRAVHYYIRRKLIIYCACFSTTCLSRISFEEADIYTMLVSDRQWDL